MSDWRKQAEAYTSDMDAETDRRQKIRLSSELRWMNDSHKESVSKKIKETYSTPEMKALQASKAKPHKEETKEHLRQINIGKDRKGEDWVESMASKQKGNQYRNKPFMTPSGAFASKKLAADWATENGVGNAKGKFDKWIKEKPNEFYYISVEEYELQKDNPKLTGLPWMENTKRLKRYCND